MNKKQYNNVIDYTLTHEAEAQSADSLKTARAVFNNMGVALPNGEISEVYETLKTNDYMGWKSCTMQEAQKAADSGTAAIGISKDRIVILSAADEEDPVTQTASVMTISETTPAFVASYLDYYSYSYYTTDGGGCNSQGNLYFSNANLSVDIGWKGYNQLCGNTLSTICWSSSDTSVASVDYYSGYITAKKAGTAKITAKCALDSCDCATFEIWVKGKTPVFLIHGRISHSDATWGIKTNIPSGANNDFDPSIDAEYSQDKKYIDVCCQKIVDFEPNKGENDTDCPCNLGNELINAGYKKNVNLFAFNYPNEDAVIHSAKKFEKYIENLIDDVRTSGSDEMKACFYASRYDYNLGKHKINLVAHSMGGLVSRYYIENLGQDSHVDKLITICTPHWGSGYANLSSFIGSDIHTICDHDLHLDSAMFGSGSSINLNCNAIGPNCYNGSYILTDELLYNKSRNTKYYAIAGIDYPIGMSNNNDTPLNMPANFTTTQQIADYFSENGIHSFSSTNMSIVKISPKDVGDNMVGFLSQIGWTENGGSTPNKKIQMEKIFVDVDTDGGNGGGVFVVEILPDGSNIFHSKVNHRKPVCDKVIEYLEE